MTAPAQTRAFLDEMKAAPGRLRIAFSTKTNPVSRLAETIAIGRTVNLAAPLPSSFMDVIERGSLSERQTVLGLIARRFNVDYLPALHLALRSPEPIIRVQAAAVAAHIRGDLNAKVLSELARCLDAAVQPGDALRVAGRIDLAIASGLVEEAERPRIERDKTRIVASALAAIDARRAGGPDGVGLQGLDEEGLEAYDCHLLEQQRFAEFRHLRRHYRRRTFGRFSFRRARWPRGRVGPTLATARGRS